MIRTVPLLIALTACTATSSDTGDPIDDPGVDMTACPAYAGLNRVGAERTFHSNATYEATYGGTYTSVSTVLSAEEVDGALEVVVEALVDEVLADGTERHSVDTTTQRCDAEGLWQLHYRHEFATGWQTQDYTAPILTLPHDLEVGDEWSSDYRHEAASHAGTGSPVEGHRVYRATSEETVTTPAGTFDTLLVELVGDGYTIPCHRDAEVGPVTSGGWYELVELIP